MFFFVCSTFNWLLAVVFILRIRSSVRWNFPNILFYVRFFFALSHHERCVQMRGRKWLQKNTGFFGSKTKLWSHSLQSAVPKRARSGLHSVAVHRQKVNPLFDEIVQILFVHGLELRTKQALTPCVLRMALHERNLSDHMISTHTAMVWWIVFRKAT